MPAPWVGCTAYRVVRTSRIADNVMMGQAHPVRRTGPPSCARTDAHRRYPPPIGPAGGILCFPRGSVRADPAGQDVLDRGQTDGLGDVIVHPGGQTALLVHLECAA